MHDSGPYKRAARISSQLSAVLVDAEGNELPAVVTDISKGGIRLTSQEPLIVGECVTVRVGRHEHKAQIRWVEGVEAGALFLEQNDL